MKRPSRAVNSTRRWKALRLVALRRDDFKCVQCGARHRLEVDHIKPVRTHPELGFEITNLQTLCASCHTRKTRIEVGHKPLSKERQAWRDRLQERSSSPPNTKG